MLEALSCTPRFNPLPPTVGGRIRKPHHRDVMVSIRSRRLSAGECLGAQQVRLR